MAPRATSFVGYWLFLVLIVGACALEPAANAAATADERIAALIDKGIDQRRANDIKASIVTLEGALAQARASKLAGRELDALEYLALSYRELPDLSKVLALRLEVLSLARAHPDGIGPYHRDEESNALEQVAGAYYLLNDLPNAIRYAGESLDKTLGHRTELDEIGVGRARQFLAQLLYLAGDLPESEKLLRQALSDFEARLRLNDRFGRDWSIAELGFTLGALRSLQRVLVAQGRSDEALEIAEAGRNRTLMATTKAPAGALPSAAPTVAQMKAVAKAYQTTIVVYTVAYKLDPDLLLEFSGFVDTPADAINIWVLRPDGTSGFREVSLAGRERSLAEMVTDARFSIGARGRIASRGLEPAPVAGASRYPALQALYELLIAPVQTLLPAGNESRLMIVPQDLLYLVPFAALQDASGQYLVSRYATFVEPSVGALAWQAQLLKTASHNGRGVLVVGNPKMPTLPAKPGGRTEALAALPHAQKEADEIAALFAAHAIVGESATKQAVLARLPSARLAHFATHGLIERDKDRAQYFDAIALAPARDDAGFLSVREINRLRLNAEMVVLSACDSADGKPSGDNMLGFSSAFLAAGVPSLVVAQWSIPDAPTALLMREFYGGILRGLDKSRALRAAMLVTMKTHRQPGSWASFMLMGEPTTAPGLATVKGDSPVAAGGEMVGFLLPDVVTQYIESEGSSSDDRIATFMTSLPMHEVLNFYRQAYARKGLVEDTALTRLDPRTASLVFAGSGSKRLHVSVVEFDAAPGAQGSRYVTLHFESRP